jgi:Peptidase family M28
MNHIVSAIRTIILAAGLGCLAFVANAQMQPGAVTEKTYGLGLPRDMDKLLPPESAYPEYPLKRGQEAYADVDGLRIKKLMLLFTSISLKSQSDGEQYWGRIVGTPYDHMTTEAMATEYSRLGLKVTRQPFTVPELWYATGWTASYTAGDHSAPLRTVFPIDESVPTPKGGITADAIWVGIGAVPDFAGRDVKGKAVIIYSTMVPGGRSHSASDRAGLFNANTTAARAGAALIVNVMAMPGNGQFNPEGAISGPNAVPIVTISQDEGFMLRDLLGAGQQVKFSLDLSVEYRKNLASQNIIAVLPGKSDEQIMLLSHTDGFFQGALDNASGMATVLDMARYYAAKPLSKRPRTLVFVATPDHHHGEYGRAKFISSYDFNKVALIFNAEHTSQTQLIQYNQNLVTTNAVSPRRWYASGSERFQSIVRGGLRDFGVTVYTTPETRAGGTLGAYTSLAPAFHIIDHVIYHTSLDVPELVPAVGLASAERAFLKIIDDANKLSIGELRGPLALPQPATK